MKIIGEVKIKDNITLEDKINIVDMVVPFIISKDENGINYTPYYRNTGMVIGVAVYLLEGIEFDDGDESAYNAVTSCEEINGVITSFLQSNNEVVSYIHQYVNDIVEFRKQEFTTSLSDKIEERLAKAVDKEIVLNDTLLKVAKNQNRVLAAQAKELEYAEKVADVMTPDETAELNRMVLSGKFDTDKMAETVMEKYLASEIHRRNEKDIIDAQTGKIKELEAYKREHDARNVKM